MVTLVDSLQTDNDTVSTIGSVFEYFAYCT